MFDPSTTLFRSLKDLAADIDRDLLRQVAIGDGGGDLGDVAYLGGQVTSHHVDTVGQVLPGTGNVLDLGLPAESSFRTDLASDAGYLAGKGVELIDHRVDGLADAEELALERCALILQRDALGQVAPGDAADDAGDLLGWLDKVGDEGVDGLDPGAPRADNGAERGALFDPAFLADDRADARKLLRGVLQHLDDVVEGLGNGPGDAGLVAGQAGGEVALLDGAEGAEELAGIDGAVGGWRAGHGSSLTECQGKNLRVSAESGRNCPEECILPTENMIPQPLVACKPARGIVVRRTASWAGKPWHSGAIERCGFAGSAESTGRRRPPGQASRCEEGGAARKLEGRVRHAARSKWRTRPIAARRFLSCSYAA